MKEPERGQSVRLANGGLALGCVGDDFTGASDAASFLAKSGLKTVLYNGVPDEAARVTGCDAAVIALKTRSVAPAEARERSLEAFRALRAMGARQLYFKYCSTFDSTPTGNIGVVADAVLEAFGLRYTLLCPSLPVNGRTVKDGRLFVGGVPLDQSPMRLHPLNPMWSDSIAELMQTQSKHPCISVGGGLVSGFVEDPLRTKALVSDYINSADKPARFYLVPDYENDIQGRQIADAFGDIEFLTGGSGLLEHLGARLYGSGAGCDGGDTGGPVAGRAVILSGSCSKATGGQIRAYVDSGRRAIALDARGVLQGVQTAQSVWSEIVSRGGDVLVYSSGALDRHAVQMMNSEAAASAMEKTLAGIGVLAVRAGFRRIIVAGGETSGAVTSSLGFRAFYLGGSVAPGVPVLTPVERQDMRIVLKSGNFGQDDFFERALMMTGGEL